MTKPADKTVKDFWKGVLDENLDEVKERLLEATGATKKVWVTCPHCKHRSEVEIADIRARTDAAKAMHALAGEMPKTDGAGSGKGGITLIRKVVMPSGKEIEITDPAVLLPEEAL